MDSAPIIALTMGDPAGIGPEVIIKAFQDDTLPLQARVVVIGDARLIQATAKEYASEILVHKINKPEEGWYQTRTIDVIDLNNVPENIPIGKPGSRPVRPAMKRSKPPWTWHSRMKSLPSLLHPLIKKAYTLRAILFRDIPNCLGTSQTRPKSHS